MKVSRLAFGICSVMAVATLLAAGVVMRVQAQSKGREPIQKTTRDQSNAAFDTAVKLGDEARQADQLPAALDHYATALKIRPDWKEGWWNTGAILYEQDHYTEARDAFRKLVSLDANNGPAWGMLGLCEFQTREYDRAIVSLLHGRSLGLASNPELQSVVRYHAALLYIHFEQFEIAFDVLSEFLRAGNDSPKVVQAFGLAILRMPYLDTEIPSEQRELVLLAGQAAIGMAARRPEVAKTAFDQLMARYPNAPNVHYAYGVFLLNQDSDAALKEFKRELEISPQHQPSMVQMAFEYLKRDDYNTALPLAEKAVQLNPKMFPARNVLGRILLQLGQIDRAIKELEEGARLAPTSPEMHYALGRAYRRAGREEDAKRETALFQKLQEDFNTRRNAELTGGGNGSGNDNNQPKPKP
jgi:tetratricopeptide (TPR) repeat protein